MPGLFEHDDDEAEPHGKASPRKRWASGKLDSRKSEPSALPDWSGRVSSAPVRQVLLRSGLKVPAPPLSWTPSAQDYLMAQGVPAEVAKHLAEISDKLHELGKNGDGLDPSCLKSMGCIEVGAGDCNLERDLAQVLDEADQEDILPDVRARFRGPVLPRPAPAAPATPTALDTLLTSAQHVLHGPIYTCFCSPAKRLSETRLYLFIFIFSKHGKERVPPPQPAPPAPSTPPRITPPPQSAPAQVPDPFAALLADLCGSAGQFETVSHSNGQKAHVMIIKWIVL